METLSTSEQDGSSLSTHRFSVASISELRSYLTSVQKKLFDDMWSRYVSFDNSFQLRGLPSIIGKQSVKEAFKGLNGSLIYEEREQNDTVFKLTVYGALLTVHGPVLASLLVRLLDLIKVIYANDNSLKELNNDQIKEGLSLSDSETQILFKLLSLGLPPRMPIFMAGHSQDGRQWKFSIPDEELINLFNSDDTLTYLNDRLSQGYRPELPYSHQDRLMNQIMNPLGQGEPLLNSNPDISVGLTGVQATGSVSGFSAVDTSEQPNQHQESSPQLSASSVLSSTRTEAEAESDLLDREKLTLALHRLLTEREDEHPFAIGLFGHWGAGKSSQVNFLQEKLKKSVNPNILFAEFNAWQNEKATNLAAMLAQAVVDGMVADKGIWEKIKLAFRLSVLRHSHTKNAIEQGWRSLTNWLSWAWVLLPQVGLLLSLSLLLFWIPVNGDLFFAFFKIPVWILATGATVYHFTRSHLTELFKRLDMKKFLSLFSLPDYSAHQGLTLEIHRTLRDLCTLCLVGKSPKEGTYLLLVVDDLDRCGVDTVKDVLDVVRLVANIPRIVTLVAIDERMAFAAVEKHYHQFGHAGRPPELVARDYLAKVLQISITLPVVNRAGIGSFVDKKIFCDIGPLLLMPTAGENDAIPVETPENKSGEILSSIHPSIMQSAKPAEATTLPFEQTPSSESPPTSTENHVSPQSSLPEEKELFKQLAQTYDFSNPRLLWRLYMAWKLLKSLTLDTTYIFKDVEILMQLLFWREWLHQLPYEQREVYSDWMKTSHGQKKPQGMPNAIYDTVKQRLRPIWEKTFRLLGVVDAVLLPSNPSSATSTGQLQKNNRAENAN